MKELLDAKSNQYNQPEFIPLDPISIPHRFKILQDREIAGIFAATLAWGQRKTIIRNCEDLLLRMDNAPFEFIKHHSRKDLKRLEHFVHRTFNSTDLIYFIHFLRGHYAKSSSLEDLFLVDHKETTTEKGLIAFHSNFTSLAGLFFDFTTGSSGKRKLHVYGQ